MVVIDTLAKIQQVPAHYNAAYPAMARLSELGRAHHCAIVVVHHQLRVGSSSRRWQERIQGSMGSLAGCDAAMGMMEDPKSKQMNLNVGGKDVAAQTILLTSQDGMWTAGLEAEQTADDDGLTDSRKALVEIVKAEGGGVPAKLIAERSGRPYANIRQQLHQMVQMAQLLRHLRLYYTPEQYSQLLADLDPQQTFLAPPQWDLRPRESIRGDGTNA